MFQLSALSVAVVVTVVAGFELAVVVAVAFAVLSFFVFFPLQNQKSSSVRFN